MKFIVSQKGSREHFLAPRALQYLGLLTHMVVDWYSPQIYFGEILKNSSIGALSRSLSVKAEGIPDDLITALNLIGLKDRIRGYLWKLIGLRGEAILKGDIEFAIAVSRLKLPEHNAFFGYSYSSLEVLRKEKKRGAFCVLDQIDPGEKEHEIIKLESIKWSNYVSQRHEVIPKQVYERLHEEWALADMIIVNSKWSRDSNVEKGAPKEKIVVLPLAYEKTVKINNYQACFASEEVSNKKIKILWLGRVTLQKGIQYLVEAARLLIKQPVEFLVAGEISISDDAIRSAPSNIYWLNKVNNIKKTQLFSESTAFVLPTLSDGFAITQLEALSNGLPVIVTPNCGSVVEDGKSGFLIPPMDVTALTNAIQKFIDDPDLKHRMYDDCKRLAQNYSLERYANELNQSIKKFSK